VAREAGLSVSLYKYPEIKERIEILNSSKKKQINQLQKASDNSKTVIIYQLRANQAT